MSGRNPQEHGVPGAEAWCSGAQCREGALLRPLSLGAGSMPRPVARLSGPGQQKGAVTHAILQAAESLYTWQVTFHLLSFISQFQAVMS